VSTILITGARAPVALDLARAFTAAGYETHLADSVRAWAARAALRDTSRLHLFAPPRFGFTRFADDLAELVRRLDPVLLVPTCEEVFYIAEAARRMQFADRVFAPPPDVLRQLHSKVEFTRLAQAAGVPAPVTRRVTNADELDALRHRAETLVFKPEFSRFASHTLVRPSPRVLARLAPSASAPWAAQDFVAGEEICIWSAARAGEVVAFAAYKPRWRLGRSASFYFEADTDPALLRMAQAIARATDATGQLSFDVIRREDGIIVPIECNPRSISGLHLFDGGAHLAHALLGGAPALAPSAPARHIRAAMWLFAAPRAFLGGAGQRYLNDLRRSGDVLSALGGGRVAAGALLDAARFAAVGLSRGRSAAGQSTDDIEWNGEPIG